VVIGRGTVLLFVYHVLLVALAGLLLLLLLLHMADKNVTIH